MVISALRTTRSRRTILPIAALARPISLNDRQTAAAKHQWQRRPLRLAWDNCDHRFASARTRQTLKTDDGVRRTLPLAAAQTLITSRIYANTTAAEEPRQSLQRPAIGRLDPQSFPHPPRAGSSYFSPTIENLTHLLNGLGFTAQFNVIKKKLRLRQLDGSPASMNQIASSAMVNGMNTGWLFPFVDEIGQRNPHNPVKDWILSEPWDGADRLQAMYDTVVTVEDYPDALKCPLLYRWLLGATTAALKDGPVSIHGVLTLQGGQGVGKTSWIGKLMPPAMKDYIKQDHHLDPADKDSILGCITHFIVELGELDSSFKKDIARIKGFLTNDCDKIRRPYAREEAEYPRKTVFAATVNDDRFLVDSTGNRRWWTIAVKELNFKHDIDMQQVFAQLALDFNRNEQHWLTDKEAEDLASYNLRHRSVSAIAERVHGYINHEMIGYVGGEAKTAIEVLQDLGIPNPSNTQCKECGAVLRELFGPPKRVQGRDKWRMHVRPMPNAIKRAEPLPVPEY